MRQKFAIPLLAIMLLLSSCSLDELESEESANETSDVDKSVDELSGSSNSLKNASKENESQTDESSDINEIESSETVLETAEEGPFPIENAKRAVVVAMTNNFATDVYTEDGNAYDPSKFHNYTDASTDHFEIIDEGMWTVKDDSTWSVENIMLHSLIYDNYLKMSVSITFNDNDSEYTLINGEYFYGNKKHVEEENADFASNETFSEPRDSQPYLIVPSDLID